MTFSAKTLVGMAVAAAFTLTHSSEAMADPVFWADVTSIDFVSDRAEGTVDGVPFTFTTTGDLYVTSSTGGGTNYWAFNNATYSAPPVADNGPNTADIISFEGNASSPADVYTITFDSPVKDLFVAVLSLGSGSNSARYDFNRDFNLLNADLGHFGGNSGSLVKSGMSLIGTEGHGLIQFEGVFSSFSWTIPDPETWHGITLGVTRAATEDDINIPAPAAVSLALMGLMGVVVSRSRRPRAAIR